MSVVRQLIVLLPAAFVLAYVSDFGHEPDDHALAAEADGAVVGAVWVRIMDDYGHMDDETPSFAISLMITGGRGKSNGFHQSSRSTSLALTP